MIQSRHLAAIACAAGMALAGAASAQTTITTFDDGETNGWQGPSGIGGSTFIDFTDGNPAPSFRTQFNNFFVTFYNDTHPGYTGDYTRAPMFTFDLDVNSREVTFFGSPVSRPLVLELRQYNPPGSDYPWNSVWYNLGELSASLTGWRNLSVHVSDTNATELPPGWGGTGDEDPVTFEPKLPDGVTFRDILMNVDEIALVTLEPGFVSGFVDFDIALDNIRLAFIPEPGMAAIGLPLLLALRRRR